MDCARRFWVVLVLLSAVTWDFGVLCRAASTRGLQPGAAARPPGTRRAAAEAHRERCAELAAPWQEDAGPAPQDNATLLQLRVRPAPPGASRDPVFPGESLFSFVRRVYRCCRDGSLCGRVRGIQGRLRGDTDVEFLLSREILSPVVLRAELHLQLSNPLHLDVRPVLSALAKRDLPTRYSSRSRGDTVELSVDLLLLLQGLQEAAGGAGGGPSVANMRQVAFSSAPQDADTDVWGLVLELGLVLGCSRAGSGVSCGTGGVHLLHTPFLVLYYR